MIEEDHCVCIKRSKGSFIILSLYVDDILLAGNDMEMIIATDDARIVSQMKSSKMESSSNILILKNKINAVDEPKNSRHPKGPLDDQSSLNEHLWHDPLHIDGRKDMTVGRIQLNCQKHYNKAFRQPLKASNG